MLPGQCASKHALFCVAIVAGAHCRQPLPVGQCCPMCNTSDWASIQWSSSLNSLQQQVPVVLGSDVVQLQAQAGISGSLKAAMLAGALSQTCTQPDSGTCTQSVRWQLGVWGLCSSRCEGGHATRSATCVDSTTGRCLQGTPFVNQTCSSRLHTFSSSNSLHTACSTTVCLPQHAVTVAHAQLLLI
jgi:hypothetical protein